MSAAGVTRRPYHSHSVLAPTENRIDAKADRCDCSFLNLWRLPCKLSLRLESEKIVTVVTELPKIAPGQAGNPHGAAASTGEGLRQGRQLVASAVALSNWHVASNDFRKLARLPNGTAHESTAVRAKPP